MSPPDVESTPLLADNAQDVVVAPRGWFTPMRRLQLVSFLVVAAMSMPNTTLLFVMRSMSCEAYYSEHEWSGKGDRCHASAAEGEAAKNIAMMSTIQTVGGIVSIFVTQKWLARGTRVAMLQGTVWSGLRMLLHIYALTVGGARGVTITLAAQLLCCLSSPGGFILATNSALMEIVSAEQRTAMFGVLSGTHMGGLALGILSGGAIYGQCGEFGPFVCSFLLLAVALVVGMSVLPYVAPRTAESGKAATKLGALNILLPVQNGRRSWTMVLLVVGVFVSILATGYVPIGLQLVAQSMFSMEPNTTSLLIFMTMGIRTVFLMFIFPRIISAGRAWLAPKLHLSVEEEAPDTPAPAAVAFDMHFLRFSVLADAILTAATSMVKSEWQLFLAAALLPFASGNGAASKGVVTEMVAPEHRQEALSVVALIESTANVATVGIFGAIYAALAGKGLPQLVFAANGVVALLAFLLLVPVRIKPAH